MSGPEVITFGCRLNTLESEVIRRHAAAAGMGDAVIVHTCAVTGEAERQARQAIRRARRDHPARRIVVTGCSVQIDPKAYTAMPQVDHVRLIRFSGRAPSRHIAMVWRKSSALNGFETRRCQRAPSSALASARRSAACGRSWRS